MQETPDSHSARRTGIDGFPATVFAEVLAARGLAHCRSSDLVPVQANSHRIVPIVVISYIYSPLDFLQIPALSCLSSEVESLYRSQTLPKRPEAESFPLILRTSRPEFSLSTFYPTSNVHPTTPECNCLSVFRASAGRTCGGFQFQILALSSAGKSTTWGKEVSGCKPRSGGIMWPVATAMG